MQNLQQIKKIKAHGQAGFSLVELMVSVVIFLIFMGAIYGLLRIGSIQKTAASSSTEVIKNTRLSLNTLGRDAVNAGFGYSRVGGYAPDNILNLRLGIPADSNSTHDLLTAVISGNEVNTNTLLPSGKTDVISFIFRDTNFNSGQPVEMVSAVSDTGVTITTADDSTYFTKPFDLFLISDGSRTALGLVTAVPTGGKTLKFQTGASDPLKVNMPYTGTVNTRSKLIACTASIIDNCMDYSNRVTAKKVIWVSYQVTSDGVLTRTIFGNNTDKTAAEQIQVQPIAQDVQNFQIKYLLRDGTVTDDPSDNGTNQANLNNVVQIDVTVTAKVEVIENGVTVKSIVNIKSTFSTKNLSYDIG